MRILRIHSSPRGRLSESYRLADRVVALLRQRHPQAELVDRGLAVGTIAHVDEGYADVLGGHAGPPGQAAMGQGALPPPPVTSATASASVDTMDRSERLIRELEAADCLVIATPMHNYTVPSALKAWLDHIVRIHRTFTPGPNGKVGTLADRPVYVAISSGGRFAGERARQPDFLTPYLTAILNTIGLFDIHYFSAQGTGLGADALARARQDAEAQLAAFFGVPAAA